jgi:hypothetical protein
MFGWIRKRKAERRKKELAAAGEAIGTVVNAVIGHWREELELRSQLALASLDERLVSLEQEGDLSLDELFEIEITAMLRNMWHLARPERIAEPHERLGEVWSLIDAVDARSGVEAYIETTYDEVGRDLATAAVIAADEEVARRSGA